MSALHSWDSAWFNLKRHSLSVGNSTCELQDGGVGLRTWQQGKLTVKLLDDVDGQQGPDLLLHDLICKEGDTLIRHSWDIKTYKEYKYNIRETERNTGAVSAGRRVHVKQNSTRSDLWQLISYDFMYLSWSSSYLIDALLKLLWNEISWSVHHKTKPTEHTNVASSPYKEWV